MNWKCPNCGNEENLASEIRCACGKEVSEEEIQHLQCEKLPKKPQTSTALKNAFIVIIISIAISALFLPFASLIPNSVSQFISHEASLVGYFVILKYRMKNNPMQIWKVVIWVWLLMASIYTLAFMQQIGTKYTVKGIIVGGLKGEILSVTIALALFGVFKKLRSAPVSG
jgi:peptidoglycan biosynthesis protein MviN/MurJ (putative lipid II flippase)